MSLLHLLDFIIAVFITTFSIQLTVPILPRESVWFAFFVGADCPSSRLPISPAIEFDFTGRFAGHKNETDL